MLENFLTPELERRGKYILWLDNGGCHTHALHPSIHPSIHPLGPYSVQSVGAAEAVSLAIGHNPGRVDTPIQYTSKLALIFPTSEG